MEDTQYLAPREPYVTSFDATVRAVDGRDVVLERTYFYPEGGGQPADRGTLDGVAVVDVQKGDSETVHTLADPPAFDAGDTVAAEIDDAFRTYSMRAHTASHVVYGAGRQLLGTHGYGGFDIGEDRIRLDFETDGEASVNPLTIQRMANEVVWESRPVDWYEMDADEAGAREDIVFNLRDDAAAADTVRIVEIEDWDVSACGGTHVRNTNEIGPVAVLDVSNPGADLVRVEYAVGQRAIDEWIETQRNASRAAETLDTGVADLASRAESLRAENESLQEETEVLTEELLAARLTALAADTFTRNGREWVAGTVAGVGPNAVADRVGELTDGTADVVLLAGRDGSTFVVVATDGETDANDIVGEVTDQFGGGGGGRPTLAQGGGLDADPETVVASLRPD
jgi:alanyl-tRNA synthetase